MTEARLLDAVRSARRLVLGALPDRVLNKLVRSRLPRTANLEATTACNLACPLCPTHIVPRASRYLPTEQVRSVIAGCRGSLSSVCFHIQGEPLVHPDLFELVRVCGTAGVRAWFGTNGMLIDRYLDEIFDSGLAGITIDIDGSDAASYAKYRRNGDFDTVVANTQALIAEKRRRGSRRPIIQVQMIMFSYNEADTGAAVAFLESFGADRIHMKRPSYFFDIEEGKRKGLAIDELVQDRAEAAANEFLELVEPERPDLRYSRTASGPGPTPFRERRLCPQLERATVLSDGRVVACCMDALGMTTFGDLEQERFEDIWRGERHRTVIDRFLKRELPVCETCTLA